MIEIKNVTKIYKSKNNSNVVALDNISFKLPDSGLVFIVGKAAAEKALCLILLAD
jgi:ABC-type ATPase involved in cell division